MTTELIAAIQTALDKQFEAGKSIGVIEHLMQSLMPKPKPDETDPPQTEPE